MSPSLSSAPNPNAPPPQSPSHPSTLTSTAVPNQSYAYADSNQVSNQMYNQDSTGLDVMGAGGYGGYGNSYGGMGGMGGGMQPPKPPKSKGNNKKKKNKKKKRGGGGGGNSFINKAAGQQENHDPFTGIKAKAAGPVPSYPLNPTAAKGGEVLSLSEITDGMEVVVRGNLRGKVKFSGSVHYAKGDWVGVVLEEPAGKNNGTVKGVEYFSCEPQHGMFVRPGECARVA
mmetsp:Transcript_1869/g.3367  ORF Transcript_1869/g.3367 Transcript_1869/m.3367 type:complete len:228 (-) Transcript_1869:81-764(-)